MSKKKKPEKIGTISRLEMIKKSRPPQDISFRTGRYMTQKDRPRDKSYKKDYRMAS